MKTFILILLFFNVIYLIIQFAKEEEVVEDYKQTVVDVEGRLEWANSRSTFPPGMRTQLTRSKRLLRQAQELWKEQNWQKAYQRALEAQEAMNRAQAIYGTLGRKN